MSVQTSLPPKSEGSQLSGSTHKPAPILQCLQPSSRHHNQKYWRPAADNPSGRRSLRISAADSERFITHTFKTMEAGQAAAPVFQALLSHFET